MKNNYLLGFSYSNCYGKLDRKDDENNLDICLIAADKKITKKAPESLYDGGGSGKVLPLALIYDSSGCRSQIYEAIKRYLELSQMLKSKSFQDYVTEIEECITEEDLPWIIRSELSVQQADTEEDPLMSMVVLIGGIEYTWCMLFRAMTPEDKKNKGCMLKGHTVFREKEVIYDEQIDYTNTMPERKVRVKSDEAMSVFEFVTTAIVTKDWTDADSAKADRPYIKRSRYHKEETVVVYRHLLAYVNTRELHELISNFLVDAHNGEGYLQLVSTVSDFSLMNHSLVRPDEIYLAECDYDTGKHIGHRSAVDYDPVATHGDFMVGRVWMYTWENEEWRKAKLGAVDDHNI